MKGSSKKRKINPLQPNIWNVNFYFSPLRDTRLMPCMYRANIFVPFQHLHEGIYLSPVVSVMDGPITFFTDKTVGGTRLFVRFSIARLLFIAHACQRRLYRWFWCLYLVKQNDDSSIVPLTETRFSYGSASFCTHHCGAHFISNSW